MRQACDGALSPNPHYYEVRGRAAEIARTFGSTVGGAEHLFLGMLHDGGWPVSVIAPLVDLGQAETAVLAILNSPGYAPPPPPRVRVPNGYVQPWGAAVAVEMGDSYVGLAHAFLAMIRKRETVPARALAGLADLDELEAVVLAATDKPVTAPEHAVFLPDGQDMDAPLRQAIVRALPADTTFGFNSGADGRTWMFLIGPGDRPDPARSREVLNAALSSLNRPPLEG